MKSKQAFICSINERYILPVLRQTAFTGAVVDREGLKDEVLAGYDQPVEKIRYPRPHYGFFRLLLTVGPRTVFDEIILPCYDPMNIPLSFYALQWYCLFFSRRTVFVSPTGVKRAFNRRELSVSIALQTAEKITRIYLLNLLVTQLALIIKLPYTLWQMGRTFLPGGMGIPNRAFWAFSRVDAGFQPWYNKIARDYKRRGRFGYAWDDGLGMALGPRIYNNWITYRLLAWLGTRNLMAVGYTVMILGVTAIAAHVFNPWTGVIIGILLAASPLLVSLYTHNGKPEIFWHGLIPLWTYLIFSRQGGIEQAVLIGITWSFLAWVNVSVPVICGLMLGPAVLFLSWRNGNLLILLAALLPGMLKTAVRFLYMMRDGFFSRLVKEQSRLNIDRRYFSRSEVQWLLPYTVSVVLAALHPRYYTGGGLLLLFSILVYWVNGRNGRIVKLNDFINMNSLLGCIGLGFALAAQSLWGMAAILFLYYSLPWACDFPDPAKNFLKVFNEYPAIKPLAFPFPGELQKFFAQIPDNTRIAAEADGDPRTASAFIRFWQWSEEILPLRGIELTNEMYTNFVEPGLMAKCLRQLNPASTTPAEIAQLCQTLGIAYIVGYTPAMAIMLKQAGFSETARVHLKNLPGFIDLIKTPAVELTLFKNSSTAAVIEPAAAGKYSGSNLSWEAEEGREYVVRYRYYSQFEAIQEQEQKQLKIPVEKMQPYEDIPLTFMRVKAAVTGPLTLRFKKRWL